MFTVLLITGITLGSLYLIGMLIRNELVFRYFMKVIERIHEERLAKRAAGIYENNNPYDILDTINYNEVVNKFWRPIDSFFPEKYRGL